MSGKKDGENSRAAIQASGSVVKITLTKINQKPNKISNEDAEIYCDPCKTENESADAAAFCEQCCEFLCKNCLKVHKRLAVTRDHSIKEGSENFENGTRDKERQKRPTNCPIHTDMELEYFCKNHDELSCSNCISVIHSNCKGVDKVSVIGSRVDFDKKLREIEAEMQSLLTDIGITLYEVKVNLDAVKLTHDETTACIKEARKEADFHLNQLQARVQNKVDGFREENMQGVKTCGKKCKAIEFEVDSVRKSLNSIFSRSNQHDKLMALKSAECVIHSSRNQLTEIRRTNTVNRYYFKPDEELLKIRFLLQSFGDIEQDPKRIKTAKYLRTLTLEDDTKPVAHITGMEVVSVDQIVTVDNRKKTMALTDTMENIVLSRIKFETSPWNVARLSDYVFAVTLPDENRIVKVEKSSENCLVLLKDQTLNVAGKCSALAAYDNKLIVGFSDIKRIMILSETGKLIKDFDLTIASKGYHVPPYSINPRSDSWADMHIAYSNESIFIGCSDGGYSLHKSSRCIISVEDGKITHLDTGENSAVATDRTGVLFYCQSTGICCYLRRGTQKYFKVISFKKTRVTSLTYSNKQNILYVAIDGGTIAMYYVV